jgi:signal transduction histidine kinase/HAMP domain-containing protein
MHLGIFDLAGVIMLVLAGTSFIYLLRIRDKTNSTWVLLWFFLCVVLSSIATIVTNIGIAWDWAFAPSQDAFLILGGVFLVRFAYLYPANDQPSEARWVLAFFVVLASVAMTYAASFAIRYIAYLPGNLAENQVYYLLTPVAISLTLIVFFRRSIHWSTQNLLSSDLEIQPLQPSIKFLFKPRNKPAIVLRNYGLSLAISLLPVVVLLEKAALPALLASFLFNFGAVIAIAALMLAYLSYAPEPISISAKLVGISLVSILLILGLAGVSLYHTDPGISEHDLVLTFIALVLLSSLLIIFAFPLFFRTALLDPLKELLRGVKLANEGDLSVQVAVQYEDEIGFLTRSFNMMVVSLNEATLTIKNEAVLLERQVAERTSELRDINQQLISENTERKEAQALLDRQLRLEQALAGCSQSLLIAADGEEKQQQILNDALEHLRAGASASRAYIFLNFQDNDLGLCMGIQAEACGAGIQPHINNPVNQKYPWSQLPQELFASLETGNPHGGPVERVFASTPALLEAFLSQRQPLLSILTLPISLGNQWWGFIGFDDCENSREWDQDEILMLRTASELVASTLQRWVAQKRLQETLESLEKRVYERTIEITQANAELRREIHERERFQDELEERLETERMLAEISARLLSPLEMSKAIQETLADLGAIMQASQVLFTQIPNGSMNIVEEIIEWHESMAVPSSGNFDVNRAAVENWFISSLAHQKSLYIKDLSALPGIDKPVMDFFAKSNINSLSLTTLMVENHLAGVIVCGNPKLKKSKMIDNIRLLDVVASLLGSIFRREAVLNMLEEKVAERTRELSAFFDLAMLSGEAQDLSDIMQPALMKIMETSASEAAVIHVLDEEKRVLRVVAQRGFHQKQLSQLQTIHLDESTMAWVIGCSENVWSSGADEHPKVFEFAQFQSDTHILLRARGKIQGLLSCYRLSKIPFNPYQVFFLNAIGEQLGLAVENYRLRLKNEEFATIQERQRLARDLHDAVSQSLYSLTLLARSGRDALESGDRVKLTESLELLEVNSLAALREMRLLLYQLRSMALEEGGIRQVLETRFGLVERRSGIQTSVHIDGNIELMPHVEQELFHLITEALNNSLKHSGGSQVSVSLKVEHDWIVVSVEDNGCGFDPRQSFSGMGLQNMRLRAVELGGQFDVYSQPGQGTQIQVKIPQQIVVEDAS